MAAPASIKLIDRAAESIVFRSATRAFTAADLLSDARNLTLKLPGSAHVINLCEDRYTFTAVFLACLLRGIVSLLPSDRQTANLRRLAAEYPGTIAVGDCATQPDGVPYRRACAPSGMVAGEYAVPSLPATQVAAIVFTSGSTGQPVGHTKSWGELAERSYDAAIRWRIDGASASAVLATVPPQHMYGFETSVLQPLHSNAQSWCGSSFFPADIEAGLTAMQAPRILVTTPLHLQTLIRAGGRLPALRRIISATAPLDPGVAAEAERRFAAPVEEIYGATEFGSIAMRRTCAGPEWQTYGRIRLEPADGNAGRTIIRAPHAPARPLTDVIERHSHNRFTLIGRAEDVIKLAGRRASLAGLTFALTTIPGVEDGVMIQPQSSDSAQAARLIAYVVAPGLTAEAIVAKLRARIDPIFLPRRVVMVDALPRNAVGKLPTQALAALQEACDER